MLPILVPFDFDATESYGLLICTGGFEDRAIAFTKRLSVSSYSVEKCLMLHYQSQTTDNEPNYLRLLRHVRHLIKGEPNTVDIHAERPISSYENIKSTISDLSQLLDSRKALVDISGMTHLCAVGTIHACLSQNLEVTIVYTEAQQYFPPKKSRRTVVEAWKRKDYAKALPYLQSAGLKEVQILPDFTGNFRPGKPTCLMVFVGYEPNRIEGLVDQYAPGSLIVFYGDSPHEDLKWRTEFSQELHADLFSGWLLRERQASTLDVREILSILESEFAIVKDQYDVAIAPQCSKMQAVASYLFWRRHPETQLLFTSPVSFNKKRYSTGVGCSYAIKMT